MKNYDLAIKDFDEVKKLITTKVDILTNLNVDPFMFLVNDVNIKKDIANAYYEKCSLYTFGTKDPSYITTKKDLIAFVSMLDNAISNYPAQIYKDKRNEAKDLYQKVKPRWWGKTLIFFINLTFIGMLILSYSLEHMNINISPDKQIYADFLTNNILRAVLILMFIFLTKFFKTTAYLENGARLAGRNKYMWNFRSKIIGERRPKIK